MNNFNLVHNNRLHSLIKDDKNKIIYFYNSKCGSINFLIDIFLNIDENINFESSNIVKSVSEYRDNYLKNNFVKESDLDSDDFKKIKIIRNPYERIFSSYCMIQKQISWIEEYAEKDERYRPGGLEYTKNDFGSYKKLTFFEFLKMLKSSKYEQNGFNDLIVGHCYFLNDCSLDKYFKTFDLDDYYKIFPNFLKYKNHKYKQLLKIQGHNNKYTDIKDKYIDKNKEMFLSIYHKDFYDFYKIYTGNKKII